LNLLEKWVAGVRLSGWSTCDVARRHGPNSVAQRLVGPFGVESQMADEVAYRRQDPDVTIGHQDQDGLSAKQAANPYVVERALVAKVTFPELTQSWRIRQH
jgi:hypothetical protein